jgi:hypothetical protein
MTFDGHEYRLDFKAAGRPADYQMSIHAPEQVAADQLAATTVYANVFNGSPRTQVELRIGDEGPWLRMSRTAAIDPYYQQIHDAEKSITAALPSGDGSNGSRPWLDLTGPKPSAHLWSASLPAKVPAGTHLLQVRAVDRHGRQYQGRRILRVMPAPIP